MSPDHADRTAKADRSDFYERAAGANLAPSGAFCTVLSPKSRPLQPCPPSGPMTACEPISSMRSATNVQPLRWLDLRDLAAWEDQDVFQRLHASLAWDIFDLLPRALGTPFAAFPGRFSDRVFRSTPYRGRSPRTAVVILST